MPKHQFKNTFNNKKSNMSSPDTIILQQQDINNPTQLKDEKMTLNITL